MTLTLVDGGSGETRNDAALRRLRGGLAERRLSVNRLAKMMGTSQQALQRRFSGQTPFNLDDLQRICDTAGLSFTYVATGIRETPGGPPDQGWSRPGESNPRPIHYKVRRLFAVPPARDSAA